MFDGCFHSSFLLPPTGPPPSLPGPMDLGVVSERWRCAFVPLVPKSRGRSGVFGEITPPSLLLGAMEGRRTLSAVEEFVLTLGSGVEVEPVSWRSGSLSYRPIDVTTASEAVFSPIFLRMWWRSVLITSEEVLHRALSCHFRGVKAGSSRDPSTPILGYPLRERDDGSRDKVHGIPVCINPLCVSAE